MWEVCISDSHSVLYLTFGSPLICLVMIQGALSLTDYFAVCPVFPSQMEQLESHESGLDGGRFIYSSQSCQVETKDFMKLIPCSAIWDNILLPVLCGESSSDDSEKAWEKGQEVFVFLLLLFCFVQKFVQPQRRQCILRKRTMNIAYLLLQFWSQFLFHTFR